MAARNNSSWASIALCILLFTKNLAAQPKTKLLTAEYSEEHIEPNTLLFLLLSRIQQESYFENLVIYSHNSRDSHRNELELEKLLRTTSWSTLFISKKSNFHYKNIFSSSVMVLVYMDNLRTLRYHSYVLPGLKTARHIVFVSDVRGSVKNIFECASKICAKFFSKDIYNVLLIFRQLHQTIFGCQKYPPNLANYEVKYLNASEALYRNQFLNMYGAVIITHPDQLPPRTMLFYDERKQLQMGGYVGNLLTSYAQKRNATLKFRYPFEIGKIMYYETLHDAARNGSVDIAASLLQTMRIDNFDGATMPYEMSSYCLMMPLPDHIPIYKIFTGIVDPHIMLAIFSMMVVFAILLTINAERCFRQLKLVSILMLLGDQIIRSFLGQSFIFLVKATFNTRLIFFLLCYMSLLTNTMYQAYLGSFLTEPPLLPYIRTYEELVESGLKILLPVGEIALLENVTELDAQFYEDVVQYVDDFEWFAKTRDSMDTHYIYPVEETRWKVFHEQQKLFKRRIFYYYKDACILVPMVLCVPIREGLPYRDLFEDHILRVHASGLMEQWLSQNFYTMVKLKLTSFKDLSSDNTHGAMVMTDLYWIWQLYLLCLMIALLAFVGELVHCRKKKIVRRLRRRIRLFKRHILNH